MRHKPAAAVHHPRPWHRPLRCDIIVPHMKAVWILAGLLGAAYAQAPTAWTPEFSMQFKTVGSVVPSAASSVLVNLTATGVTADGYLTAYPTATEPNNPPLASNLNFTAGQTVPNLASIKVGLAGKISIFNFVGSADVVVDLAGWYG